VLESLDSLFNLLTKPEILFPGAFVLLWLSLRYARVWTEPPIALGIGIGLALLFLYAITPGVGDEAGHEQFLESARKADNVPITMMLGLLYFFFWLALRKGVENDRRIERGLPPIEADEKSRKVLVWPDLVYTELIAMVAITVILIVWAVLLPAPIEEPANPGRTPNPAKAPWYFLGLQEMLVYFDPWLAGILLPALIMVGLICIPYLDRNPKGNGYYTLRERYGAIFMFLFGFLVLWVLQVFIGTFLRGYGWNFFGVLEKWDVNKVEPLQNIDVSEIFFVKMLGMYEPESTIVRELPGILLVLFYMTVVPVVFALTKGKKLFRDLGAIRFGVMVNLGLLMMSVPIKMVLRWLFNLKYIVNIPELQLNI
jgi:hypothetical protein